MKRNGWRVALELGRVSNLPTVWSNVLAGMVLSGHVHEWGMALRLMAALSLIYVAGMYLNDAFDRDIDRRERPERPIPSGRVSARVVFAAGYGLLVSGLLMLAPMGWRAFASGALLAAVVVYYNYDHKANRFSPLVMGLCRMLTYITSALAATGGAVPEAVWLGAMVLLAYLMGLTYVAKHEQPGKVMHVWPLLGLACPMLAVLVFSPMGVQTAPCLLAFGLWTGHCLRMVFSRQRRNMRHAVGGFIAGISLADALAISVLGLSPAVATATAAFLLTLVLQRKIAGT
ncbi:MAG: UbiA family prenyltransferase [Aquabacterium sp.]|uniref:UbiA family prenyltransferase n=1 Tax=Aquabacterium sp. TaxID=1872578 RepID=UPI00271B83C0|nr:UbiA family prenyltransferase [Aquabacterium sp.]MDO9002795.1 UbiA family prenyltransferase [Aquabacterium sp.]